MSDGWRDLARAELLRLRARRGWGDRLGGEPRVEPTALAGLALLADDSDSGSVAAEAAGWLAGLQGPGGALGVSASLPGPNWPTAHALLLWANAGDFRDPSRRAARWLLRHGGLPVDDQAGALGHDPTLIGWPWVEGTHSWLEPTAMAVLALRRCGLGDHSRVREGLRLIRDRAIPEGGWNYGNPAVFGRSLRPQPAPTGLALLALAGEGPPSVAVDRAVAHLQATLPGVRSAMSLGWGLLALRAWSRAPEGAGSWLAEAHARIRGRPDAAPRLAMLLLAGGGRSPGLFGF